MAKILLITVALALIGWLVVSRVRPAQDGKGGYLPEVSEGPEVLEVLPEMLEELRHQWLTRTPVELGKQPREELPLVYGVVSDIPIGEHMATVLVSSDGDASLYVTTGRSVIGGHRVEAVRAAALRLVEAAQAYHDEAVATTEYSYPAADRIRHYLLTFSGVRFVEAEAGGEAYADLMARADDVITELRLATGE